MKISKNRCVSLWKSTLFAVLLAANQSEAFAMQNPLYLGVNRAEFVCPANSPETVRLCDAVETALRNALKIEVERRQKPSQSKLTLGILNVELEITGTGAESRARLLWSNRKKMSGGPIEIAGRWLEFSPGAVLQDQGKDLAARLVDTRPN